MKAQERSWDAYCVIRKPGLIHPGLAFLARASVRLYLVERDQMTIEEAIMGLAHEFWELVHPMSDLAIADYDQMERLYPIGRSA